MYFVVMDGDGNGMEGRVLNLVYKPDVLHEVLELGDGGEEEGSGKSRFCG